MDDKMIESIEKSLEKGGKDAVLAVVEQVREIGVPQMIPTLVSVYKTCGDDEIKMAIFKLLSDNSNQAAADIMCDLIGEEDDINVKQMLVTTCWYSKISYIDRLEMFIDMVIEAPFELAFEAFTVIENQQTMVTDVRKEELLEYIGKNMEKVQVANEALASGLSEVIKNY